MSARMSLFAALALWLLACAAPLAAQERIDRYDIQVEVQADGSLEVTELIRVQAEGRRIRRGIYRDFPTRYRDRYGNRVVVGFEVLEVLRDGRPEPWFTESISNGARLNTGDDDFLQVPATYAYTLRYRTTRQLGFFDAHDELYWNAIGTGWEFPIEAGSVDVKLPQPVPPAQLQAEAYTGAQGAQGRGYAIETPGPGHARWRLTAPLAPGEGLTIVLGFPKGVVAAPGNAQQLRWLLADNRAVLIACCGLLVLLAWCIVRWRAVGRDPAPGTVVVRYTPPPGISPAGLRHVRRMGYDQRCFTADLLALAVAGELRIERHKRLLKDQWTLHRTAGGTAASGTPASNVPLLDTLFAEGPDLVLDQAAAEHLQKATRAHWKALDRRFRGRMFHNNGGSSLVALLIAVAFSAAALLLGQGNGLLFALVPIGLMVVTVVVFAFLVRAHTPEGRRLLDEIEGLRRYLGVAERQDLQRLQGPGEDEPALDAARFEALLPYAVALDVEEAWTKKFTLAVGAAAAATATASMAWYHGGGGRIGDLGGFTRAIGSGLTAQIASSSSPPGSSSGGGGGGFSGGGGGGGGGGGR